MSSMKTQFILTGFRQDIGVRTFAFDSVGTDRSRTSFTVHADLSLARKYGITLQELPLLCRSILEAGGEDEQKRSYTFSEADMQVRANIRAASKEAAQKRRAPRRPGSNGTNGTTDEAAVDQRAV
jgi:hypothetical protein